MSIDTKYPPHGLMKLKILCKGGALDLLSDNGQINGENGSATFEVLDLNAGIIAELAKAIRVQQFLQEMRGTDRVPGPTDTRYLLLLEPWDGKQTYYDRNNEFHDVAKYYLPVVLREMEKYGL